MKVKRKYLLRKSPKNLTKSKFCAAHFKTAEILPKVVDLRNLQSPVKDQGELGYCFAFATVGLREYLELKNQKPFTSLSELFLGYEAKESEGDAGKDTGCTIDAAMQTLQYKGTCEESLMPYKDTVAAIQIEPSLNQCNDAYTYCINNYQEIDNLTMLKVCLAEGGVAVIGIEVYDSFESDEVEATGVVPMPNKSTETCQGGHAVLVVGYDDTKQHCIVKNSWSSGWGDKGYFYLPYGFFNDSDLVTDMYTGS
jgi:C1A family cysteine protease